MRFRTFWWLAGVALVVLAAACGDSSSDAAGEDSAAAEDTVGEEDAATPDDPEAVEDPTPTAAPDPAAVTEAVLRDANPKIGAAIHPEEGLFEDVTLTVVVIDEARSLIEETLAALPDAAEVATIRTELEAWDGEMADAAATLEADSDRLQADVTAWLEGQRDGPPPMEYTDILDRIIPGAEGYKAACLAFAAEYEVAPDCNSVDRDPTQPASTDDGELTTSMGDTEIVVEVGPVEGTFVDADFIGVDLTPFTTFTILLPPDVADPTQPLDPEAVVSPIGWPADPAGWAAALPVAVESTASVTAGDNDWATTRIVGTDESFGIIVNEAFSTGAHVIGPNHTIQWWETTVEDQPVVAILDSVETETEPIDDLAGVAESILASLSAATG